MRQNLQQQNSILILVVLAILLPTVIGGFAFYKVFGDLQEQWSETVAQIQVDADRNRTLIPIINELGLLHEMLNARVMLDWYDNPKDPSKERLALDYLNSFKERLQDKSYFIVLEPTLVYYYNDGVDKYEGQEARYTLSRTNPEDAWFFVGLELDRDLTLNVDFDRGVNALKLWINKRIYIDGEPVGIAGTGFELTQFLGRFVQSTDSGFTSVFTNDRGAIQLSQNSGDIQYGALRTPDLDESVIFNDADTPEDRARLERLFQQAKNSGGRVVTDRIHMGQREQLVGVAYFANLNWFEVTRVDSDRVLTDQEYLSFYLIIIAAVMLALMIAVGVLSKRVFDPVGRLNVMLNTPPLVPERLESIPNELGGDYQEMAIRILQLLEKERESEDQVERLELELSRARQKIATTGLNDPITGMLTEASFRRALEAACATVGRMSAPLSVLMVRPTGVELYSDRETSDRRDDRFLRHFAYSLHGVAGASGDIIGRVNGRDFAISLPGMGRTEAEATASRIQQALRQIPFSPSDPELGYLGCSIGVETAINEALASPDRLLRRAEQAVYISAGKDQEPTPIIT